MAVRNVAHKRRAGAGGGFAEQFELEPVGGGGAESGTQSHLIDTCQEIDSPSGLTGATHGCGDGGSFGSGDAGSGSDRLSCAQKGFGNVREVEVTAEHVRFALPPEIVAAIGAAPEIRGRSKRMGNQVK